MLIKEFGGEHKIINSLVRSIDNKGEVIKGAGDDCSVVKLADNRYQLISSDMYVDGDHFSTVYFSPLQIGKKIAEASLSDIAAMGGKAKYFFFNLSLRKDTEVAFLRSIFRGVYKVCDKYGVMVLGGDMVKSSKLTLSATVVGEVTKKNLCYRDGAKIGDYIKVTGELGGSTAGFALLKRGYEGHEKTKNKHLEPRCRLDIVEKIAPYATAMQDISDGLGSEVKHIAKASEVGAIIYHDKIPITNFVYHSAKTIKQSPQSLALYGGEDFELVYTVPPEHRDKTPGIVVGEITEGSAVNLIAENGTSSSVQEGFQHF